MLHFVPDFWCTGFRRRFLVSVAWALAGSWVWFWYFPSLWGQPPRCCLWSIMFVLLFVTLLPWLRENGNFPCPYLVSWGQPTWHGLGLTIADQSMKIPILVDSILLSASLYVSKRGAYWDRLCRDVVGRWLVGWLSRACTVAKRCILGL